MIDRSITITLAVVIKAIANKRQKQPSRDVLMKRCSENMQQIYRGTTMPKCVFKKNVKQLY